MEVLLGILLLTVGANCLYSSNSDVVQLNPSNFDKLVINSDEVWIVEFFAPWCGHCKALTPEYDKAATALKGVVKVGAVDADEHKSLGSRFGVRGFPTIKIFGANKNKPEDFRGDRTASDLVNAALSTAKDKVKLALNGKRGSSSSGDSSESRRSRSRTDVIELTDDNFDSLVLESDDIWLVEFFAPWCGHCKNLEPEWASAATALKGKVKLGALDATVHQNKAREYGIRGYPTIKYFAPGSKGSESAADYDGGRVSSDIVNWALEKWSVNVPPPEVIQLVGKRSWNDACDGKQICVVSVLPHILDCQADCRNGYISTLQKLADKFKQKDWGWLWAEAGAQPDVEEGLEIGGFGYPALAAINAKKLKYSLMRGSFSYEGINEFLRDLSYGRGGTAPVRGAALPKVLETKAWDGQDGEPPQEEDIDLSDVDLDEKDEL